VFVRSDTIARKKVGERRSCFEKTTENQVCAQKVDSVQTRGFQFEERKVTTRGVKANRAKQGEKREKNKNYRLLLGVIEKKKKKEARGPKKLKGLRKSQASGGKGEEGEQSGDVTKKKRVTTRGGKWIIGVVPFPRPVLNRERYPEKMGKKSLKSEKPSKLGK